MEYANHLKAFLISSTKILLTRLQHQHPSSLPTNHEAPAPAPPLDQRQNLDWPTIMVGFCLASAFQIAVQTVQAQSDQPPSTFHFLSLVIFVAFAALFVAKSVSSKFPVAAQVLEGFGIFSVVTAFCFAITITYPKIFKCIACTGYVGNLVSDTKSI
ncbi:hypothetical protein FNV43_RR20729 [Rhamnella rubrinervis]|uniref:Uncharacterized protein n=1 Tax=Rhamnella rubrinervis TaxID=2594499 RepID=A0A8K0E0W4_9ROSA|nr:hypothetical protein FNV43_RR20729 [Rhamnella rubrinervis]